MCPTFPDFYRSGTLGDAPKTLGDALEWSGNTPKRREMSGNVRKCPNISENGLKTSETVRKPTLALDLTLTLTLTLTQRISV